MKKLGLYIHSPFCRHKCGYCDFNSWAETARAPQVQWWSGVEKQFKMWGSHLKGSEGEIDTVFWGGGTPSLIEDDLLLGLGESLRQHFRLSESFEWTMECNPETLHPQKLHTLAQMGVTRLSVGIQSFQNKFLERLERQVRRSQNLQVLEWVSTYWKGPWSLDLMFALPQQTLHEWDEDLTLGMGFSPEHVSAYQLTLSTQRSKNWQQAGEDELEKFYRHTCERLENFGLERYEVSNFSKPQSKCQHNLKYWHLQPFLSVGPGGAGLLSGSYMEGLSPTTRFGVHQKNPDSFEKWLAGAGDPEQEARWVTARSAQDHLYELLMMGLRLDQGISQDRLCHPLVEEAMENMQKLNLIAKNGHFWQATERGRLILHTLLEKLYGQLEGGVDFEKIDPTFV